KSTQKGGLPQLPALPLLQAHSSIRKDCISEPYSPRRKAGRTAPAVRSTSGVVDLCGPALSPCLSSARVPICKTVLLRRKLSGCPRLAKRSSGCFRISNLEFAPRNTYQVREFTGSVCSHHDC